MDCEIRISYIVVLTQPCIFFDRDRVFPRQRPHPLNLVETLSVGRSCPLFFIVCNIAPFMTDSWHLLDHFGRGAGCLVIFFRLCFSIPTVPRDKKGRPLLPLNVGIMTVINLGEVCMREHFHTERYIFPVGYEVTR